MSNTGEPPVPEDRPLRVTSIAERNHALTWVLTEFNYLRARSLAERLNFTSVADVARLALQQLLDEYDTINNNALANDANTDIVTQAERAEEFLRHNPDLPRL